MNMIKWLKVHLDRKDIPGLRWVTLNESFHVDWVHCGSQDWSPERLQVFIEYAIHREKAKRLPIKTYKKKDVEIYKRNFRSALDKYKKKNIIEGPKIDTTSDDPHREYRFVSKPKKKKCTVISAKEISDHISDESIPCWNELEMCSLDSATSDSKTSESSGSADASSETAIWNGDNSINSSPVYQLSRDGSNLETEMDNVQFGYEHSQLQHSSETTSETVHSITDTTSPINDGSHVIEARALEQDGLDVLRSIVQGFNMMPGTIVTTTNDLNVVLPPQNYINTNNTSDELVGGEIEQKRNIPDQSLNQAIPDVLQAVESYNQQDPSLSDSSLELPLDFLPNDILQQNGLSSSDVNEILNENISTAGPSSSDVSSFPEKSHLQCPNQEIKQTPVMKVVSLSEPHVCNNEGTMNIDIYAKGHFISSHHIENPNGCMIFNQMQQYEQLSEAAADRVFGDGHRDRQKIPLDSWRMSLDVVLLPQEEKARQRAQNILKNVLRPVVLSCVNGDIKIERHCTATIQSNLSISRDTPNYIKRFDDAKHPETIFSGSNYFGPSLTLFEQNLTTTEPSTSVYLVIGQKCKNFKEDFLKALLALRVTSCEAQRQLDRVQEDKSRSISLTNSLPNSVDALIETFKECSVETK